MGSTEYDGVDVAVAAYRDGDDWQVADLAHDHLSDCLLYTSDAADE